MINTDNFLKIDITEKMVAKAKSMASGRKIESSPHYHPKDEYFGALAELCIRKLLYENNRKYEAKEIYGASDGGIDITIKSGTLDVKGSGIEPGLHKHLFAIPGKAEKADLFAQVFICEDQGCGYFVGMERKENLIRQENLTNTHSDRYNMDLEVYGIEVKDLSILPERLLSNEFTDPVYDEVVTPVVIEEAPTPRKRTIAEIQAKLIEMAEEVAKEKTPKDVVQMADEVFGLTLDSNKR